MVCNLLKKEIMLVETVATMMTMKYYKNDCIFKSNDAKYENEHSIKN